MSAPASVHHDAHTALLEVYQILRGAAQRARLQAATVTAGPCRPLGAGARPEQQEDHAQALEKRSVAFLEDDREAITTDKHAV
jgi:hypothetical protein